MTTNSLANILNSADLTGAVVVHDAGDVVYAVKTLHPFAMAPTLSEKFVFYLSKDLTRRIGIIENMGDDIFVYVKPEYRGRKYTATAMRELVPYLFPQLYSVTSACDWQDAKIQWLTEQANLTLRYNYTWNGHEFEEHCNKMRAHKEDILTTSDYARALQEAEENPKGLRVFPQYISNPMRFTYNVAFNPDFTPLPELPTITMDYRNGVLTLEGASFNPSTETHTIRRDTSLDDIHRMLKYECQICSDDDDERLNITYDVYENTVYDTNGHGNACLHCVKVAEGQDGLSCTIIVGRESIDALFESIAMQADCCNNKCAYFAWGTVRVDRDGHLVITWRRPFSKAEIRELADNYRVNIEPLR